MFTQNEHILALQMVKQLIIKIKPFWLKSLIVCLNKKNYVENEKLTNT